MNENPTQALQRPASQAVATKKDLKSWLAAPEFRAAVEQALPKHMTPDRFVRVALTCLMRVPKLAECSKESVFKCMLDCSSLGLEPDGRLAHLIPYGQQCTLILDYKGLIQLAKRSGEVSMWQAFLVCENDDFSWEDGRVKHKIDWLKPRGKTLAVYSHVRTKDGEDDYEVMTLDECEAIRKRSRAGSSGPWVTDVDEMRKKTVIRRHSKRLTLSPEFREALDKDDDRLEDEKAVKVARPVFNSEPAGFLQAPEPVATAPEPPLEPESAPEDDLPFGDPEPPAVLQALPTPQTTPTPAPAAPVAEKATQAPVKATPAAAEERPQVVLARTVEVAGFTFDQFMKWGYESGNVTDKGLKSWADLSDKQCAMFLRSTKGLLGGLGRMFGK